MIFQKFTKYSVIFSLIPAIYFAFFPGKIVLTSIIFGYPLILFAILSIKNRFDDKNVDGQFYIKLFYVSNIVILVRGIFDAQTYQDWTTLLSAVMTLTLFIPYTIYFGTKNETIIILFRTFINYGLIVSSLLYFGPVNSGPLGFTHILSPLYILILFIPFIKTKHKIIIIVLALFSFFSAFTIRANLLNIAIAFLIAFTFLFKNKKWALQLIKHLRILLLTAPVIFIFLGLTGQFNIFEISKVINKFTIQDSKGKVEEFFVDSRTSIYLDVFNDLNNEKSIVFGKGGSGKTKTSLTDISYADFDKVYKEGRRGTESGMLNYIQWGGIFSAIIYFLLFIKASKLGIYKSNNWLCIMIGLWVAYKGLFSFIEDELIFSISALFILVPIGMCFNKNLRAMSNEDIEILLRNNLFIKF